MINPLNYDLQYTLLIVVKLLVASSCGAIIGLDRMKKRRPAGIKTHALVCMGAALVMITGEFISIGSGNGDVARLGAQVISGIGFLGTGVIMVTGANKITGLTTAAGLWFSGCLGLSIGIGLFSASLTALIIFVFVIKMYGRFDSYFKNKSYIGDFIIMVKNPEVIDEIIKEVKQRHHSVLAFDVVNKKRNDEFPYRIMNLSVSFERSAHHQIFLNYLERNENVITVDES